MDYIWVVSGIIILVAGLAGCIIPALPGPPLAYLSLIFLQFTERKPFSLRFLLLWAAIVLFVTILDYVIPPLATRKMGGSRAGVLGSTLGIIAGIFIFPPFGIIIFPFLGAWIGEVISGKNYRAAIRAATGSFLGFLGGVFLKLAVTISIGYHFISVLVK